MGGQQPAPPAVEPGKDYRTNWWADFYHGFFAALASPEVGAWLGPTAEAIANRVFTIWFASIFKVQAHLISLISHAKEAVNAQASDSITTITAQGLSEFFGTPVDVGAVRPRAGTTGHTDLATTLGDLMLSGLFGPPGQAGPPAEGDGQANANRLLGMGINLGITGFIEDTSLPPILHHLLPGYGHLREAVAQNLGMGRLTRRGLAPLLNARIVAPFTKELNNLYRNTQLSVGEAVRAFNRGDITREDLDAEMGARGYNAQRTGALIAQNAKYPALAEMRALLQGGDITDGDVLAVLKADGYSAASAAQLLLLLHNERVHGYLIDVATLALEEYSAREITREELDGLADQAGLSEREKAAFVALAELKRGRPKHLTVSEAEAFYLAGVYTLDQYRAFLSVEGYSEQDVIAWQTLAVQKKQTAEQKAQLKAPLPALGAGRPLSEGQAVEAYRRGLTTDAQLAAQLAAQGFKGDALAALEATALLKRTAYLTAQAKHTTLPKGAALPKTTEHEAYVRGLLSRQDYQTSLAALGYTAEAQAILLELADGDKALYAARQAKAAAAATKGKAAPAASPQPPPA